MDGPSVALSAEVVGSHELEGSFNNPWEVEAVRLWKNPENVTPNLAPSLARSLAGTNGPIAVPVAVVGAKPELELSFKKPKVMAHALLCQKLDDATPNNATSPAKCPNGTVGPSVPPNVVVVSKPEPGVSFNNPWEAVAVQL
jgi:hypothetical protein